MFWIFELDSPTPPASRNGHALARVPAYEPSEEQIRRRAYEIFIARGGEHGNEQADWEQAERELREWQSANS